MRDAVAIVAPAVDVQQLAREIAKAHVEYQDGERALASAEKKAESLRGEQARRRVDLGRMLVDAKRGVQHGQWSSYLEKLGIESQRASEWMRLAGYVDLKSPTFSGVGDLKNGAPTLADAGIDRRPRKREQEQIEIVPKTELEQRAIDIDRELSRWHQKVVSFAELCPAVARKQIAHELRQMANAVESIEE